MTETEGRALNILAQAPRTCANLGAELWGWTKQSGGSNCSCPFARPAGAVVKRLRAMGLVERQSADVLTLYVATRKGKEEAIKWLRNEGRR